MIVFVEILIAGGTDKKLDFRALAGEIKKSVDELILLPGTGTEQIKKELRIVNNESRKEEKRIRDATSMQEAVQTAFSVAQKGDWIVLSPGATSFGLFLNEFDRGDQFVHEVSKLKS